MYSSVIVRFEILLWLYEPELFPGLSRNGPHDRCPLIKWCEALEPMGS